MRPLKICSFNVQGGIERKFQFEDVCSMIDQFDVVFIQETWLVDSCHFNVRGYGIFRSDRGSHKKKNTGSGGVVTLYKQALHKGLHKLPSRHKDFMWIKLDKSFFNLPNDIYIANCYIAPEDSVLHRDMNYDIFDTLGEEISKYSKLGEIIITGDLNARTGDLQEKLIECQDNLPYDDEINIDGDLIGKELKKRNNTDKVINLFGRKLIDIVETFGLAILNGRTLGDTNGEKTCYTSRGSSTVDYFIVTTEILKHVRYMKVKPQTWYSDHSPIELSLTVGSELIENNTPKGSKLGSYVWDDPGINRFKICMNCDETKSLLANLKGCMSVDETLTSLLKIIGKAADCSLTRKSVTTCTNNLKPTKKSVYDNNEIKNAKRAFNTSWKLYRHDCSNKERYRDFIVNRRKYKRLKYLYFRYKKEDKLIKLANIESKNPKLFWKTIRSFTQKDIQSPNVATNEWVSHFKHLLNVQPDTQNKSFLDYIQCSLPVLEQNMSQGQLDYEISDKELENAITKLKNGKAVGPDKISNEMIKHGGSHFHGALKLLFNRVISSGCYPKNWRYSIITPIHKSGNLHIPSNYRGIAVADCISKILNSILNDRIYEFFQNNGMWAPNQNGFMKKRRTEDNVFILHTLFQKYVKAKRQRLYLAFIDFSKYFDTINRHMLMYKLLKYNITGNIYRVIKTAYEDSYYCIKTRQGNTPYFSTNNGVKQGCNLSPTLSNIYQNDIHNIFDTNCYPVEMDGFDFNSLSWADDLVLISKSMEGLQCCMNKVSDYCNKWGLMLNVDKTKFMVMSLGTIKHNSNLLYKGTYIERVATYKYLGLLICSNGKFNNTILDRHNKAQKAYYQIRGVLSTTGNVSRKLALTIFDKQITPILLYGSCIWGQSEKHNTLKVKFKTPFTMSKATIADLCSSILNRPLTFDIVRYQKVSNEAIIRVNHYMDKLDLIRYGHTNNNVSFEHIVTSQTHKCEKLHTNFCKFVLGVSKFSSNYACLGELGRVPLTHKMFISHVMYWLNLERGTTNCLLNYAYRECKAGSHDFIESIKHILLANGMGNWLHDNMNGIKNDVLKSVLSQRLRDQYTQTYEAKVRDNLTDLGICKLGQEYRCSPYLDTIRNVKIRNIFTRLRINQSKLKGHQIGSTDKKCTRCDCTEDAKHFLFECQDTKLVCLRLNYLNQTEQYSKNFKYLPIKEKTKQVLCLDFQCPSSCHSKLTDITCNFVNNMYNTRLSLK